MAQFQEEILQQKFLNEVKKKKEKDSRFFINYSEGN